MEIWLTPMYPKSKHLCLAESGEERKKRGLFLGGAQKFQKARKIVDRQGKGGISEVFKAPPDIAKGGRGKKIDI